MDKKKQNEDWKTLCEYMKKDILGYSDDMKFPKVLALRLKGLSEGKFMANKNITPEASYSFETILLTCKACKHKIHQYYASSANKIQDESHRINLAMMFIENEINDVVVRLKRVESSQEKLSQVELTNQVHEGAEYVKRTKEVSNKKLKDLW